MFFNAYTFVALCVLTVILLGIIYALKKQLQAVNRTTHILQQKLNKTTQLQLQSDVAKSDAIAANLAKNRYLSGISHELRTPLNVIMGYAQLLENQTSDDDRHHEKYTLIRHNCEHLAHLIEGILEFSAIESGKLKVKLETGNLQDLLNQIIVMFSHQAEQKGLNFSSKIDPQLPHTVKTDHKRLQQILLNLLNNAIKFTDTGGIEFNITYRNQVATFSIKDTGRGIEQTDLSRIFEPFERIEHTNKPTKGTGLGLPITRLLVDLLGGELQVSSQINHGSVFTVKMMLAAPFSQNQARYDLEPPQVIDQQLNSKHPILVVDDEPSHRELLVEILTPLQFNISTAANAKQAQELINNQHFSLAIIDVAMPETNGWQLATWLKIHAPKTKIMMLSANPRDVEASSDNPYDAYLTKPLKIKALLHNIKQLLALQWQQTQPTSSKKTTATAVNLPAEHLNALMNMLEIGHINGIESYLTKLKQQQVINHQQHQQLLRPIKHMNLSAFKGVLENEH